MPGTAALPNAEKYGAVFANGDDVGLCRSQAIPIQGRQWIGRHSIWAVNGLRNTAI